MVWLALGSGVVWLALGSSLGRVRVVLRRALRAVGMACRSGLGRVRVVRRRGLRGVLVLRGVWALLGARLGVHLYDGGVALITSLDTGSCSKVSLLTLRDRDTGGLTSIGSVTSGRRRYNRVCVYRRGCGCRARWACVVVVRRAHG